MTQARRTRTLAPLLLLAALAACDQRQDVLPTGLVPAELQLSPTAAAAPPTGACAKATSLTSIQLTWTDASADEDSFIVARRIYSNGAWSSWQTFLALPPNNQSVQLFALTPGRAYHYRVTACKGRECSQGWSVAAPVLLPLLVPPTVTAAQISPSTIRVRWTRATNLRLLYDVEAREFFQAGNWGPWVPIAVESTSFTDMLSLKAGDMYQFRVRACSDFGCSDYGTSASVTMATKPAAPQNIGWVALGAASITLDWTDASNNETRFEIFRAVRGIDGVWNAYQRVAKPPANTTVYSDTGLMGQTAYRYRIRACNLAGCSIWNSSAIVFTL